MALVFEGPLVNFIHTVQLALIYVICKETGSVIWILCSARLSVSLYVSIKQSSRDLCLKHRIQTYLCGFIRMGSHNIQTQYRCSIRRLAYDIEPYCYHCQQEDCSFVEHNSISKTTFIGPILCTELNIGLYVCIYTQ